MAFADSAQGVCYPEYVVLRVHVTWQQKMCLVRKPDIVKKVWHSVNLVAKPLAHDRSLPHVVKCKLLFNLYPVRIHVEICDQNFPHGLPVDSKLLTSPTHRLAWAVDNRVSDSSNMRGILDDFGRPECDCLFVSLRLRLCTVPWVLNLLTHV